MLQTRLLYFIDHMKLWLAKNSEVAVTEQIVAQVTMAIASGDLSAADKLPSTGEIARRFDIHPNTVSAAYQRLVDIGLVEFHKGKGYFVADRNTEGPETLEAIVADAIRRARQIGFGKNDLVRVLGGKREVEDVEALLLIESDAGLRDILIFELRSKIDTPIVSVTFEEFASGPSERLGRLIAMSDEQPKVDPLLDPGRSCFYIRNGSVAEAMKGQIRPADHEMIAVASGWDDFLTFARLLLLAAKIEPGNLIVRSTNDDTWQSAISPASMVVCDALTANRLSPSVNTRVFNVVSADSISELLSSLSLSS